jgi:5-methyltetrahydrofolate--homocysteine methyltransferase
MRGSGFATRRKATRLIAIERARERRLALDWNTHRPPRPRHAGLLVFDDYPLGELVPYIDWSPFFATWELKGRHPTILDDPVVGTEARKLHHDATVLLTRIVEERHLSARAVVQVFAANTIDDDDIAIYHDDERHTVRTVLRHLRQQIEKPPGRPAYCLADFVAPRESGLADYIGAFAVTAGHGLDALCERFEQEHDDYQRIMASALADRLAEALAERLHERVRREFWAYAPDEHLAGDALIREKYVGIRPAPGYPACPDHSEKRTLFDLLDVTATTGIALTESCAMTPAASVCGWYFSHPRSTYFGLGKIDRDQVEDYARRKNVCVDEIERWLAPHLAYDPERLLVT